MKYNLKRNTQAGKCLSAMAVRGELNDYLPTPRASGQENPSSLIKRKGLKAALKHNLTAAVKFLPTPVSSDSNGGPNIKLVYAKSGRLIRKSGVTGTEFNPKLRDVVAFQAYFNTLTTQDSKCNGSPSQMKRQGSLNKDVAGMLNPDWVEWFMGYPIGWTDLNKDVKPHLKKGKRYFRREPKKFARTTNLRKNRVPRIKALGNAIVPQVALEIFEAINQLEQWRIENQTKN